MMIVIGSGPSGVACAISLLQQGCEVLMVDAGLTLEPARAVQIEQIRRTPPANWNEELLRPLKDGSAPDVRGVPKKFVYGSDFPFQSPPGLTAEDHRGVDILSSYARGGLSNVWGANVLPFLAQDIDDWPITLEELQPYYQKVGPFIDVGGEEDDLSTVFPFYGLQPGPLRISNQAARLVKRWSENRAALQAQGIVGGRSRVAIRVAPTADKPGCIHCGLCLYGCPYDLIFNAAQLLPRLDTDRFRYAGGLFVERIVEKGDTVTVHVQKINGGDKSELQGDRVFLGAGAVSSTRIIAESLGLYDQEILLRDSQYFLTPFFCFDRSKGVTKEKLHTLSQLALEFLKTPYSSRSVHVLVYTYNDLYLRALERMAGIFAPLVRVPFNLLLERLVVLQGYLHSDDSPAIAVRLERGMPARLILEGRANPRAQPLVRHILRELIRNRRALGGIPVTPMAHIGAPGKSYHAGASFPMRQSSQGFESDTLGRPCGMQRTHLIDASCLTSIPATNVTFTVMANAFRIGEQASESC